jgi:hypothetical protein
MLERNTFTNNFDNFERSAAFNFTFYDSKPIEAVCGQSKKDQQRARAHSAAHHPSGQGQSGLGEVRRQSQIPSQNDRGKAARATVRVHAIF